MYRGINFACDLIQYIWYFQALLVPMPCNTRQEGRINYGTF